MAGRDDAVKAPVRGGGDEGFTGLAPDARIVNVKVADATGATDVSQVIAGLDWIVEHGRDGDLDVRVVNLSFGTDGVQDHRLDPLAYAVERAWHAGFVVVVSAGNAGHGSPQARQPGVRPVRPRRRCQRHPRDGRQRRRPRRSLVQPRRRGTPPRPGRARQPP